MKQKMAAISLLLLACIAPASLWSRVNTSGQLVSNARKAMKKAEKELERKNYKKSNEEYQKAIGMLEQAQQFGENVSYALADGHRGLGNSYSGLGRRDDAIREYLLSEGSVAPTPGDDASAEAIGRLGLHIKNCAVCSSTLPYWEALMYLYRVTGDSERAARTEQELKLHQEANVAYRKAYDKAFGIGKGNWMLIGIAAATTAATQGNYTPTPDLQTPNAEEEGNKGRQMGWYAKMDVYRSHNRPEYVAQCVQEMKNRGAE